MLDRFNHADTSSSPHNREIKLDGKSNVHRDAKRDQSKEAEKRPVLLAVQGASDTPGGVSSRPISSIGAEN